MSNQNQKAILQSALAAHRAGDFLQAKKGYEAFLLHAPDRPEILYNLALVLIALDNIDAAAHYLEAVLDKTPGHADALNNLGALLLKKNQTEQALQCFAAVLSGNPDHLEARNNLAAVLLQLGRYFHASEHYRFILEKHPDEPSALQGYKNAISNIGIDYLKAGDVKKARDCFEEILKDSNPAEYPEISYLYSAMTQENIPDKPPAQYIQNLFDHYAEHYDQHMINSLNYHTPELLYKLLTRYISPLPKGAWHILDAGCGSGLAGITFKPLANNLTGIDLSAKMLEAAQSKFIYDKLIQQDIIAFLENTSETYDLILAADVFNYFGALDKLLALCKRVLKPHAYLIFSLELLEKDADWMLSPHGRYWHQPAYVENIAFSQDFTMMAVEPAVLRAQNHMPVKGSLYLFQRCGKEDV